MSTDNRTMLNDCEANTGWTGDDASTVVSNTGEFYEGSSALSSQFSDTIDEQYTTQDSVGMGTFNIDLSDSTVYMLVKDNLGEPFSTGGMGIILGDGTNRVGYYVGGNDATGIPLSTFFNGYKLDVSVIVATPGSSFTTQAGSEASLSQSAITQIGLQTNHLAKANGPSDNCFYDAFRYIANDSYALTINGGTSGTPETTADVAADDVTNGWGMVSNPVGSLYYFFAPTEWGTEGSPGTDDYFSASSEQWLWLGDNGGGHSVGSTHFPMRVISGPSHVGSFVLDSVVVVNVGTGAEFDCSDTNVNTLEIDSCSFDGLASFNAPSSGGTSRFCTNTTFSNCGQVTSNLCDMSGNNYITSTVATDGAALFYNETLTGAKSLTTISNSTFERGTNEHHAITFGTGIDENITLTGMEFTSFRSPDTGGSPETPEGATLNFLATTGSINCSLVNCTVNGNPATTTNVGVATAGISVTLIVDPVTTQITTEDQNGNLLDGVRVFLETADNGGGSGFPYQASVSSLVQGSPSGWATLTSSTAHGLATNDYVVVRGANDEYYNKVAQITVNSSTTFDYPISVLAGASAGGTPTFSYVAISGTTDTNGTISSSKTWPASQGLTGWARKSTSAPYFKQSPISISDASGGTDLLVLMISDE